MPRENAIQDFIAAQMDRVSLKQEAIVHNALDILFDNSPHSGVVGSRLSKSEYDANHKININGTGASKHIPPTNSLAASKAIIEMEKIKAKKIKCGDSVTITNDTPHAREVEDGSAKWERPGYATYNITKSFVKGKNKNVLK